MIGEARRSRLFGAACVATLAVLCAALSPTVANAQARIAFVSERDGGWGQIYVMNANGKGQTRLTFDNAPNLQPNFSPSGDKIAYTSYRDGNFEIYVMNADGTGNVRLTNNGAADYAPCWSPDGSQIVFVSRRSGNNEIWKMKADGTNLVQLTNDPGDDTQPAWCWDPNNNVIAFVSNRKIPNNNQAPYYAVWTMNPDGTNQVPFTDADDLYGRYLHGAPDQSPTWSPDLNPTQPGYQGAIVFSSFQGSYSQVFSRDWPKSAPAIVNPLTTEAANGPGDNLRPNYSRDGARIVFDSNRGGVQDEIWVMNSDGTNQIRLTMTNNSANYSANFSTYRPLAQTRVAFVTQRDKVDGQIYTMNRDGSDQQRLTYSPTAANLQPAWSPDRRKIAFASNRDGNFEIYVMDFDGNNQTRITNLPSIEATPSWSPDGSKIVFCSNRTGSFQIYTMNPDGSAQTRITFGNAIDLYPTYSPDGAKILFQSDRFGSTNQVYAMNTNGTGVTQLTVAGANSYPNWSPDQQQITFSSTRDGHAEIYRMTVNGSGQTRLSNTANGVVNDMPSFSPDGGLTGAGLPSGQIVFRSNRSGRYEIYVMNSDGTTQTRITTNNTTNYSPAWSPYPQVLFVSDKSGSNQIYRMNSNGTVIVQMTTIGTNTNPVWAPDYYSFAFVSDRDGSKQIYTSDPNGGSQTRRTNAASNDSEPTFTPDSTSTSGTITFVSDRAGSVELFNMDIGTGLVTQLTNDGVTKGHPSYAPDATQLTFSYGTGGNSIVATMNADGTNMVLLAYGKDPAWSPNGDKIAFTTDYNTGANFELFIITVDGAVATRITQNIVADAGPAWSTDGRKFVYYEAYNGGFGIFLRDPTPDTSSSTIVKLLLTSNAFQGFTNWQPSWAR